MKQAHFYILFSIVHISISVYSYISNIKYRYQKQFFLLYFLGSTYHYSLSNILYIYIHVSFSAQPSKFHYVIGGQLHNEIQSAHIPEILRSQWAMSANTECTRVHSAWFMICNPKSQSFILFALINS